MNPFNTDDRFHYT